MDKKKSRREFVKDGITTGIAFPILVTGLGSCNLGNSEKKENATIKSINKPLNILILGGSSFLGPHQIAYAIGKGHTITTFTRGKTKPSIHNKLYDQVEHLIGDRDSDLSALYNRKWDAVIDNSGHNVEWTKKSAELLKENCDLYMYTSSTGVFYPYVDSAFTEESEVNLTEPDEVANEEEKIEYWYGVMKANSELEAIKQFGKERTIVVRPTYMIGPSDKSNRFIHWPIRLAKGGEALVPGKENDMVQYIDVRDVAEWMIRLIEDKVVGTFNAVGPKSQQNMYNFVEEAQKAFSTKTSFVRIDDYEFLKGQNIHDIVPWIMPIDKNMGSAHINNEKGIANGLTFTPLIKTVKDTYDWWNSDAVSQEQRDKVELDPESILMRESAILKEWKKLS